MAKKNAPTDEFPRGVARPARRALASIGVTRLAQLTRHRREDLLALHGVGPKALRGIERAMVERGLAFKP